jgi:hypothetical protein
MFSKIQFFLWLLSHNKLVTIDNLNKRGMSKPVQCQFCSENESIMQRFFSAVLQRLSGTILVIFWEWRLDWFYI